YFCNFTRCIFCCNINCILFTYFLFCLSVIFSICFFFNNFPISSSNFIFYFCIVSFYLNFIVPVIVFYFRYFTWSIFCCNVHCFLLCNSLFCFLRSYFLIILIVIFFYFSFLIFFNFCIYFIVF